MLEHFLSGKLLHVKHGISPYKDHLDQRLLVYRGGGSWRLDLEEPLGFVTLECEDRVQRCLAMIERERGNEGREETGKNAAKRIREACRTRGERANNRSLHRLTEPFLFLFETDRNCKKVSYYR